MKRDPVWWPIILSAVLSALCTSGFTYVFQTMTMSKYEENTLIQSLVPSLTSSDPMQIQLAIDLLDEAISPERVKKIKLVIDKKVEKVIDEAVKAEASLYDKNTKIKSKSTLDQYVNASPTWQQMAKNSYVAHLKPISAAEFAQELEYLGKAYIQDPLLDEILKEAAVAFRDGNYLNAYIAADWISRKANVSSETTNLNGLIKIAPKDQATKIVKYKSGLYQDLEAIYNLRILAPLSSPLPKSQGEEKDRKNKLFLEDLKKKGGFENLFNPVYGDPETNRYQKIIDKNKIE